MAVPAVPGTGFVVVETELVLGKGMRLKREEMDPQDDNLTVSGSGLHIEQSMRVKGGPSRSMTCDPV